MDIRLATLKDIDAICPLLTEFFTYNAELQPMYCKADDECGKYPKSVIESDNADFLIAATGDTVVGLVHIAQMDTPPFESIVPHDYAEILAFMVMASHREQGVGSKLMEAAKKWSIARKLDYIELAVMANAKEALQFYKQKGFDDALHTMRYTLNSGGKDEA